MGDFDTREQLEAELGRRLVERGLVTADQLRAAKEKQAARRALLGDVLTTAGLVSREDLYKVIAAIQHLPYLDLTADSAGQVDGTLMLDLDPERLIRERWVPVRRLADGRVLVAAAWGIDIAERTEQASAALRSPVEVAMASDHGVIAAIQAGMRDRLLDRASLGLWRRSEDQSARRVLVPSQAFVLGVMLTLLAVCAISWPAGTLSAALLVIAAGFLVNTAFKFVVCMAGARREHYETVTDADVAALGDKDLPAYTVLVPAYREASIVAGLIANLGGLQYPKEKLEILILLEEDDEETIAAVSAANPPSYIRPVLVPAGQPRTKPKACNVGLYLARGEFIVIYDAEDKPEPDQLKKAVIAFRRGDDKLACVQAALNYWNVYDNVLTRMFTLEYSFWFDYMLPGLDGLHLPIPLGGTSNHFRTVALHRLGGWDPFNVTEDADLGIRAAAMGYTIGVINSTTFEEANNDRRNWIRQRSRWIKGYLQTLLVHLRHPVRTGKSVGFFPGLGFLLLIGGTPVTFLCALPLMLIFIASLFAPDAMSHLFSPVVLWLSLANMIIGNEMAIYVSMMGAFKRKRYSLVLWSLLTPFYWMLHSIASYKALWQLIVKPYYWEKTNHGLSTAGGPAAADAGADSAGATAARSGAVAG